MCQRRWSLILACGAIAVGIAHSAASAQTRAPAPEPGGVAALASIVGVWQSDTTDGVAALSICTWTPEHDAVLCEQRITTPKGLLHALNLFTYDPGTRAYVYYGLSAPGEVMRPVPLAIRGAIWIYGGQQKGEDGQFHRTINDFSARDHYAWRQESSTDGATWTVGPGGSSRRVRPPAGSPPTSF